MNVSLSGKKALVCGSTQGIGWATALVFAELGADVTLVARNENKLKENLKILENKFPGKHAYLVADFSKPDELRAEISSHIHAGNQYHILVNNTGGPPAGPAHTAETTSYLQAFSQHLVCNQILVQNLLPGMKEMGYGRIVNVISTSVKIPLNNLGVSNTVRGAVASWSKTLANELGGFGITVNNVLPGATETSRLENIIDNKSEKTGKSKEEVSQSMTSAVPAGRFGKPEEIANAIAFLAGPSASYINGVSIPVDGGRTGSL